MVRHPTRTRQALRGSGLGSLLCFDQYNIRYITSTVIGNWARDKFTRYALLAGDAEPHLWDFGSAAKHHRLFAPWLPAHNCHAGMLGLRGAIHPKIGLMRKAAEEIGKLTDRELFPARSGPVSGRRRQGQAGRAPTCTVASKGPGTA